MWGLACLLRPGFNSCSPDSWLSFRRPLTIFVHLLFGCIRYTWGLIHLCTSPVSRIMFVSITWRFPGTLPVFHFLDFTPNSVVASVGLEAAERCIRIRAPDRRPRSLSEGYLRSRLLPANFSVMRALIGYWTNRTVIRGTAKLIGRIMTAEGAP